MNIQETPLLDKCAERYGIRVFRYGMTDSTNTRAKEYARSAGSEGSPAVFITRAQSAGRGTRGRAFESPDGAGLYISFLIYPALRPADAALITTYAATRVCRAVERVAGGTQAKPLIKWVNDIYLNGKKLSGILTEGAPDDNGALAYAIVGIGINIRSGALPHGLCEIATSLADNLINTDTDTLAAILTEEFFGGLAELGTDAAMREYRERSLLPGRRVRILSGGGEEEVTVTDIGDDGSLIATDSMGNIKKFISADTTIIKEHQKKEI